MPTITTNTTTIRALATLEPACNARTWLSSPHPHLPLVATACSDRSVRLYSLQTFRQQATIAGGHKRSVRACAWKPHSPGESVLVTGSFDASAAIWKRWEQGDAGLAGRGPDAADEIDFTDGLAGSGAGRAHGERDGDGDDDDDDDWRLEVLLDGHDSEIKSVTFCPTGPLLATCSRDKSIWIWEELEGDNFETVAVLQMHEGDVKCVAWHPTEQLLASGSYDDHVRLWREDVDDWDCCALLEGHAGTVWWVEFEGAARNGVLQEAVGGDGDEALSQERTTLLALRERAGPRLMTCSDDLSIRVWRKVPKEKPEAAPTGQGKTPSIWKNNDFQEDWIEEAQLPQVHDRSVYSISWSTKTGKVVSAGGDGKIVVYEERWRHVNKMSSTDDVEMSTDNATISAPEADQASKAAGAVSLGLTQWIVVAEMENAHDVFEVNHVVWAPRADKGRRSEHEEVIVSTGDDGEVKVWTIDG